MTELQANSWMSLIVLDLKDGVTHRTFIVLWCYPVTTKSSRRKKREQLKTIRTSEVTSSRRLQNSCSWDNVRFIKTRSFICWQKYPSAVIWKKTDREIHTWGTAHLYYYNTILSCVWTWKHDRWAERYTRNQIENIIFWGTCYGHEYTKMVKYKGVCWGYSKHVTV